MSKLLSYRGRTITSDDITLIKNIISAHPDDSRRALSRRVCQAWNWTQANGQLKDMVCRGLLLHLERKGYIVQPPPKCKPRQYRRKRPEPVEIDITPVKAPLKEIRSYLSFKQVRRTAHEKLFNSLIEQYHYLAYAQPVGEHLKYIVFMWTPGEVKYRRPPPRCTHQNRSILYKPHTPYQPFHAIPNIKSFT